MRHGRPLRSELWPARRATAALIALATALGGCRGDEKVVKYKPFFAGLEGAEFQTAPVDTARGGASPIERPKNPEAADESAIERTNPDGTITLISRSGLHLMRHIERCLAEEDADLFAEQVLCETSREEFAARGLDPKEALAMLKPAERDISRLFSRMPLGEHSPSVLFEPIGRNVFRVRLTGMAAETTDARTGERVPLRYTGFDMVLERDGNLRLRWFF